MAYNTGSRDDWDRVSRITGDPAWTWDAMAHYRDLNQRYVPPNDGHDDVSRKQLLPPPLPRSNLPSQTDQYIPWAHSHNGMVPISLPGFPQPLDSRVIATTAEPDFASEFPFQRDMNTGNTVRFIAVVYSPTFFYCPLFGNRSASVGYRAPLATAVAAALLPPTLGRTTSIVRTYISYFTFKLRKFSRQLTKAPQLLASMGLSLDLQPDYLVS